MPNPTPVKTAAGAAQGNKQATGTPAGNPQSAPDAAAQLEAITKERDEYKLRHANLQRKMGEMSQELGVYRKQRQSAASFEPDYPVEDDDSEFESTETRRSGVQRSMLTPAERQRLDFIDFRLEHPDYKEYWEDVLKTIEDPFKQRTIVAFSPDDPKTPDYFLTWENALREVQLQRYRAKEAEVVAKEKAAKEELDKRQKDNRRMALASGGDTTGVDDVIDLSGKSSDEILAEMPAEMIDMSNPPSAFRRR